MANQFLALSLFLILLSFFIVMNAVSAFEDMKTYPALNSISIAFSSAPLKQLSAPEDTENPRASLGEGDTFERLNGLFNAHISNFQMSKNRLGTQMYMRLPLAVFENSIDIPYLRTGNPSEQGAFLPTLVSLLRSEGNDLPYRMEMFLNIPAEAASYSTENPQDFAQNMRAVSSLAEKLERNGLPKYLVSAGLKKGESGYIELIFMKHKPYNPLESAIAEDARP